MDTFQITLPQSISNTHAYMPNPIMLTLVSCSLNENRTDSLSDLVNGIIDIQRQVESAKIILGVRELHHMFV